MKEITSFRNDQIKHLAGFRQRSQRDATGLTLIDGRREILRAVAAGIELTALYYAPDDIPESAHLDFVRLADTITAAGGEVWNVKPDVLRKAAFGDRYEGALAVARIVPRQLDDLKLPKNPFLIVVETVEKPGNLGAVLRIADAAGADAVIAADPATDLFNPNVIRASTGTVFTMPAVAARSIDVFDFLRRHKICIVVATPGAEQMYAQADLTKPTAIVFGSEQDGLSAAWLEAADDAVSLPMAGSADSLNVATTAAVIAFEVVRQRAKGR